MGVPASHASSRSATLGSSTTLAPPLDRVLPGARLPPPAQAPTSTGSMDSARQPARLTPPQPPPLPQPPPQPQQLLQLQPQPLPLLQHAQYPLDLQLDRIVSSPSLTEAPHSPAVPSGCMVVSTRASCGAAPRLTRRAPM